MTNIKSVEFEDGDFTEPVKEAYMEYLKSRDFVYGDEERDISLMDLATIVAKELKKREA